MVAGPEVVGTIRIETKGAVRDRDTEYLRKKLDKLTAALHDDRVEIDALATFHPTHDDEHRARAQASLRFRTGTVRAETRASTLTEAADQLEERLRRQLEERADRQRDEHRRRSPNASWRHGNAPSGTTPYFDRPADERSLVSHKTFATPQATLDEARWDRFLLDYDFYLFVDADTGTDTVLSGDGEDETLLRLEDAQTLEVDEAIQWLDTLNDSFLFFRDAATDRGAVVYRRYDGHYGLLTPR